MEEQGEEMLKRLVRGASDAQLERRFGNQIAQRALFTGMARQFDPKFAFGFEGDIVYELAHTTANGSAARPLDDAREGRQRARRSRAPTARPAVTFKLSVPDFARLAAEETDPQELIFSDRFGHRGAMLHISRRRPRRRSFGRARRASSRSPAPPPRRSVTTP